MKKIKKPDKKIFPGKQLEIESMGDPEKPLTGEEEDQDLIPYENLFETPPYEPPIPGEAP